MSNLSIPGAVGVWNPLDSLAFSGARSFDKSVPEYFTRSTGLSAVATVGRDQWWSIWFYADTAPASMSMMGMWDGTPNQRQWLLYAASGLDLVFYYSEDGSTSNFIDSGINLSTGAWYHMFAYIEHGVEVGISISGSSFVTAAFTSSLHASTTAAFEIGSRGDQDATWDGRISNASIGAPPSTPTWVDLKNAMYNSGQGLRWNEITDAQKTAWGLTPGRGAYYQLNELSGNAFDAVDGLDLTDTNTVGSGLSYRTKILDWGSNKKHATPYSGVSIAQIYDTDIPTALSGIKDWSGYFGDSMSMDAGNYGDLIGTEPRSWSFWYKSTDTSATGIASKRTKTTTFRGWQLNQNPSGNLVFVMCSTVGSDILTVRSPGTINDGNWHHCVVTYDGSRAAANVEMYIDGSSVTPTIEDDTLTATCSSSESRLIGSARDQIFGTKWLADFREYDDVLTSGEVATLYGGSDHASGLYNHYDFSEGPGEYYDDGEAIAYVRDSVDGNEVLQTTAASRPTIDLSTYVKPVLVFDGTDDALGGRGTDLAFERTDPFSVSIWVRCTDQTVNATIPIGQMESASNFRGWAILVQGTAVGSYSRAIRVILRNTPSTNWLSVYTPTSLWSQNEWFHIAFTYDGSVTYGGCKIYYNGVSQTLTNEQNNLTGTIIGTGVFALGSRNAAANAQFPGQIGIAAIWDSVLTVEQIRQIMDETNPQTAYMPRSIQTRRNKRLDWFNHV